MPPRLSRNPGAVKGKLKLLHPPLAWFEKVIAHHGLTVLPLEQDGCITAAQLPRRHHDPCDRFIIPTAQLNGWPAMTADERFEKYGLTRLR